MIILAKINIYIKKAKQECLNNCETYTVDHLYRWLDMCVIPCCSMNKSEQDQLKSGLSKMLEEIKHIQTKLVF